MKLLIKENGYKSLYRGFLLTMAREACAVSIYFSFYYKIRDITGKSHAGIILSGGLAGMSSWFFTYPIDILKT